jgi:acyl dehydratase
MPHRQLASVDALKTLVGQEVVISDWLRVTQEAIDAFANVTHDRQWIHVDPARAASQSPYGTTIAHGFFTLALISHLHGSALAIGACARVINYGLNRLRFPAPVPAGSNIRSRSTLLACEDQNDYVQAIWQIAVEIEGTAKPAAVAEWVVRLYRAPRI